MSHYTPSRENDNTNDPSSEQLFPAAVSEYIEKGWIEPLPLPAGEKKSPPSDTTGNVPALTAEEIRTLWEGETEASNVGLRMPETVICIDVDNHDGKPALECLEALEADLGSLKRDEIPRSTRRGVDSTSAHYFFQVPAGIHWKGKACAGVDILQMTHRYAVAHPSVVEGLEYKWYLGTEEIEIPRVGDLPELPEAWIEHLKRDGAALTGGSSAQGSEGLEAAYQKAAEWLEAEAEDPHGEFGTYFNSKLTGEALEEFRATLDSNGYYTMVSTVYWSVKVATTEAQPGLEKALNIILEAYAEAVRERRASGAPEFEFKKALTGAVEKIRAGIESGEITRLALPETAAEKPDAPAKVGSWRDRSMSGGWLDSQEFPELQWTVPGLIPEGYGVIVAPPKAGKSWLVANVGLAAASGGKALGSIRVDQRPVLYMALEDGPRRLQDRYRKLMEGGPIPEALESITEASRDEALAWLEEFATEFADQRPFIILDTLGKVMGQKSSNQSAYAHDYEEGSRLKRIAALMPGGTLLVVHHTNKGQHDDFQDAVSGTQGIAGAADFTMHLARKRKSPQGFLSITGRDVTENEYAVTFQEDGRWTLDGGTLEASAEAVEAAKVENKQSNLPRAQRETLEILSQAGEDGLTATEFAPKAGISPDTARNRLKRMAEDGVLIKTDDKRYKVTPVPRTLPLKRLPDNDSA